MNELFAALLILLGFLTIAMFSGWIVSLGEQRSEYNGLSLSLFVALLIFGVPFGGMCYVSYWHSQYDYVGTVEEFSSKEQDGVDIIVDVEAGRVINLNERFEKNFEDGTTIYKVHFDKDLGWFYSSGYDYRLTLGEE